MIHSLHKTLFPAALAATALFPLRASDGRIPIAAAPYAINAPGVYYLTRDLINANGDAITIGASPVTLDLNSHTITNGSVSASDQALVTIRNGTIKGPLYGVNLSVSAVVSRSSYRLEDLTLSGGTIQITNTAANPMEIRVERNTITGSQGGIVITGANAGHIIGNHVNGCTTSTWAITVYSSANLDISRNALSACNGIRLGNTVGSHLDYNIISGGPSYGLTLTPACNWNSLEHNTVTGLTTAGPLWLGSGISIDGQYNAITANHVAGNAQYGIYFFGPINNGNIYTGNSLPGNTAGSVFGAAGNQSGGGNCNGNTCS